jgi:hypothetical protein
MPIIFLLGSCSMRGSVLMRVGRSVVSCGFPLKVHVICVAQGAGNIFFLDGCPISAKSVIVGLNLSFNAKQDMYAGIRIVISPTQL